MQDEDWPGWLLALKELEQALQPSAPSRGARSVAPAIAGLRAYCQRAQGCSGAADSGLLAAAVTQQLRGRELALMLAVALAAGKLRQCVECDGEPRVSFDAAGAVATVQLLEIKVRLAGNVSAAVEQLTLQAQLILWAAYAGGCVPSVPPAVQGLVASPVDEATPDLLAVWQAVDLPVAGAPLDHGLCMTVRLEGRHG